MATKTFYYSMPDPMPRARVGVLHGMLTLALSEENLEALDEQRCVDDAEYKMGGMPLEGVTGWWVGKSAAGNYSPL